MCLRKPKNGEKNNYTDLRKKSNRNKTKLGSLLLLLAFFFYFVVVKNNGFTKPESKPEITNDTELAQFTGKVVSVSDGDTFKVLYKGKKQRIRLMDIDCPETGQPFGKEAKQYANSLCYGKTVTVKADGGRDQYGRILGYVYVNDTLNINAQLVKEGLAWRYKYSENESLKELESQAKKQHKGLWVQQNPINPWEWRKQHSGK